MISGSARIVRRVMNRARMVLMLLVINHIISGVMFSVVEDKSLFDGQWWATVTGFTVGYGDFYPETTIGRLVAMFYIISMAVLWLVLAAHIVASVIEDKNMFTHEEQERMEACLLEIGQTMGMIPAEFTKLPPTTWFAEKHGFQVDQD